MDDMTTPEIVDMRMRPGHLIRRAQQVHNHLWASTVSAEVTSTQFAVLSAIEAKPSIDQNTLSREASLDTSTTADVVNRLHDRGYVVRSRDREDRRRNLLTLSEDGERLFAEISVAAARMSDLLVECLTAEDRRRLIGILTQVVEAGEALRESTEGEQG